MLYYFCREEIKMKTTKYYFCLTSSVDGSGDQFSEQLYKPELMTFKNAEAEYKTEIKYNGHKSKEDGRTQCQLCRVQADLSGADDVEEAEKRIVEAMEMGYDVLRSFRY